MELTGILIDQCVDGLVGNTGGIVADCTAVLQMNQTLYQIIQHPKPVDGYGTVLGGGGNSLDVLELSIRALSTGNRHTDPAGTVPDTHQLSNIHLAGCSSQFHQNLLSNTSLSEKGEKV